MADMKFQSFVSTVCGDEFSLEMAILTVNYTISYHTEVNLPDLGDNDSALVSGY